jgi:RecA-family ATPase
MKVLYLALEPDTSILDVFATITTGKRFRRKGGGINCITAEDLEKGTPENIEITGSEVRTYEVLKDVILNNARYDLIVIDHIGYFSTDEAKKNDDSYLRDLQNLIQGIARLTKDSQNSILAVAHLNREGSKKKSPTMFDLKNSSSFEQDGTDVWILTRTEDPFDKFKPGNKGRLIVAKGKPGSGSVKVNFHEDSALITTDEEERKSESEVDIPFDTTTDTAAKPSDTDRQEAADIGITLEEEF